MSGCYSYRNSYLSLYNNGSEKLRTQTYGVEVYGDIYADRLVDRNSTGYYVNPNGETNLNYINTNARLRYGTGFNLEGNYLGQAIYSGGAGDNSGTVFDIARYKNATLYGRNGGTWTNLGNINTLLDGSANAAWGGITLSRTYQEFVIWFGTQLGYAFLSNTTITHSTNGNTMNIFLETKESVTNPYESGFSTERETGNVSSWPGGTSITHPFGVGGGYRNNLRIRIVPNWNHASNSISLGSIQIFAAYGGATKAYWTDFDRNLYVQNDMYANTFYDRTDPSYYLNPNSTSRLNAIDANSLMVRGNTQLGNGNGDVTHINDIVHIGATDSGDADLYFGEGSTNNIRYGVHWDWNSGYRFTWYTRNNGSDSTLFYYDTNSTSYVYWGRSFHMGNRDINYVNQLHFNAND
jgi:hypothetical protein